MSSKYVIPISFALYVLIIISRSENLGGMLGNNRSKTNVYCSLLSSTVVYCPLLTFIIC